MFGGYETSPLALAPIPVRVESQPAFGVGKYTTAADLARLARSVWLAPSWYIGERTPSCFNEHTDRVVTIESTG